MFIKLMEWLQSLKADEEGQTLVEYALILALIVIVVIVILGLVGDEVEAVFNNVWDALSGVPGE